MSLNESLATIDRLVQMTEENKTKIPEAQLQVQYDTLRLADALRHLEPHTLPATWNSTLPRDMWPEDAGKPGIEITSSKDVYVIFSNGAGGVGRYGLVNERAIETDPATLQQFRERLPAFLASYDRYHRSKLVEVQKVSELINQFERVIISYLKKRPVY